MFEFAFTHVRLNIEKIESKDLRLAFDMKLDHFSQIHIHGEHVQRNEWGQSQGDKWQHSQIYEQFFDVVKHQHHHHNYRKN